MYNNSLHKLAQYTRKLSFSLVSYCGISYLYSERKHDILG